MSESSSQSSIPSGARIGHVHLRASDLDRQIGFYRDVLGFDLINRYGDQAAFLSAGGYHHHIGLNTWESKGSDPAPKHTSGLYHFAINYPERRDLAVALKRILDAGWQIGGGSDHGTHEAIYLDDYEGNGLELAWDRDPSFWMRDGKIIFDRSPLPWENLLAELNDPETARYLPYLNQFQ